MRTGFDPVRVLDEVLDQHAEHDRWAPPTRFAEALRVLMRSFRDGAELHALGRRSLEHQVRRIVAGRSALDRADVLPSGVAPLVIIVGLPRTGTTLLHHALAELGRLAYVPTWSALFPLVDEGLARGLTESQLRSLQRSAPDFVVRHPVGVQFPAECPAIMEFTGLSRQFEVVAPVWQYSTWLSDHSILDAYEQYLCWARLLASTPDGPLVLKAPAHLLHADDLATAAPDALVIWMHRDPAAAVASGCSMVAAAHRGMSRRDTRTEIGLRWMDEWPTAVERTVEALAGRDVIHIRYQDLGAAVGSTLAVLARRFGTVSPSPGDVRAWLSAHTSDEFGHREYRTGPFGLDPDDIRAEFHDYVARFELEVERVR